MRGECLLASVASCPRKSGKKLDIGNGCGRFESLEYLALDVVGRTVASVSVEEHMANYQAARALMSKGTPNFFASEKGSRAGQPRKEGRQEVRGEESRRHAVNQKTGTLLMH